MATSTQWQVARDAAERYEQVLVPAILGPAARALVDWSKLQDGETVLDVGCGTGAAARFAAVETGPSGRVAGVDVNAGMIDVARSLPPVAGAVIEWFEHSADRLPFPDGAFDVALCAQTLQFLQDRPLALAEMYRVLRPGGRIAVSLWCDLAENPYFHALVQAVSDHVGTETASGLRAAFSLPDPETIRALLTGAGFAEPGATVAQLDLELPSLAEFVPRHVSATPMAAGFHAASAEARQRVVQQVAEQLSPSGADPRIRVPFRTHLMMSTK